MFKSSEKAKEALRAVARLEDDLASLRVVVEEQQSTLRQLELEWIETYDKVRHQMSRMAKRYAIENPKGNGKGDGEFVDPGASGAPDTDPISKKIHERRSRGFLTRPVRTEE